MYKCMGDSKTLRRLLLLAFLPVVCLTGCHGGIGWDRLQTPVGFQNNGGLDQTQRFDVGHEEAGRSTEHDTLMPSAGKIKLLFQESTGYPRSKFV